jgi:hypothetical protein
MPKIVDIGSFIKARRRIRYKTFVSGSETLVPVLLSIFSIIFWGIDCMYRLSELETNNKILGREELREHAIEASRGCTGYNVSHREHSGLRLAIIVSR